MFRISNKILQIQEKDRKTGEQFPDTPLVITGSLALFAIVMTFIYYIPPEQLGIYGTIIQRVLFISGILLYIASFTIMFFIGRTYSRPGFPKKAMSSTQISIGLLSAILPFLLLLVLGKFVASGGLTRDSFMNPSDNTSVAEVFLIIILLVLPSISGVFGAGVFGKMSLQN
jgi:hypothetical protein